MYPFRTKKNSLIFHFLRYRKAFVNFSTQNCMGFSKLSTIFILDNQEDDNLQRNNWDMFCGTSCMVYRLQTISLIVLSWVGKTAN